MASVTLRAKPIDKKGFSLFLDIYNTGQRYKEYLKLYVSKDYTKPDNKNVLRQDKDSWELAQAIHAKRLLMVKENASGFVSKISNEDCISYYRKQAAIKEHSTYLHALRHLLYFSKSDKLPFKRVDEVFLKNFIAYLKDQDLSNTSIRLYLSRLNIVMNLAVRDKLITVNPLLFLKKGKGGEVPPPIHKKIEYLTFEELKKMRDEPIKHDDIKAYFLFCCFTGLRESDLLALKWTDIEDGKLAYTQKKQGNSITHYLPLSKQAKELLGTTIHQHQAASRFNGSAYVFGHIGSKRNVLTVLKKWATKSGINKNIHMHVGRHTFATMSLTYGASLYTVSKMLGHSQISTTQIYAEVINEVKQQAADLLPQFDD